MFDHVFTIIIIVVVVVIIIVVIVVIILVSYLQLVIWNPAIHQPILNVEQ